jgi:hypothetical protein
MNFKETEFVLGDNVYFEIYEKDLIFDELIKTVKGTVLNGGDVRGEWSITQEDLDKARGSALEGELNKFYFKIKDKNNEEHYSNDLELNILEELYCESHMGLCANYSSKDTCEKDICSIGVKSVIANYPNAKCGVNNSAYNNETKCYEYQDCRCIWNNDTDKCGPAYDSIVQSCEEDPAVSYLTIGKCSYSETFEDNCDDGFLTYSYIGNWVWDSKNNIYTDPKDNDYTKDDVGTWHYNPLDELGERSAEKCYSSSNTISCPAYAQLPFFGIIPFMTTIALIIAIYYFNHKKKFYKKIK